MTTDTLPDDLWRQELHEELVKTGWFDLSCKKSFGPWGEFPIEMLGRLTEKYGGYYVYFRFRERSVTLTLYKSDPYLVVLEGEALPEPEEMQAAVVFMVGQYVQFDALAGNPMPVEIAVTFIKRYVGDYLRTH
jgi:hypothetical protein